MIHWPSELAFSDNFYPHPAEDGYAASAYPPSVLSELHIVEFERNRDGGRNGD